MFSDVHLDKALDILEAARIDSTYQSLPLKDIQRRARSCGTTGGLNGQYYDCWAVHQETARFKFCAVLAQSIEGAKVQMEKYIGYYLGLESSEYVLFIGKESQGEMIRYRSKLIFG